MSTSTLGRIDLEDRKVYYDAYLFQRRILFGCTISISLAAILFLIAIVSDHWVIVAGESPIYVPLTKRYFLYSHTGLWRVCRYTIIPEPLSHEALPRNFTDLSFTNQTDIDKLKRKIAHEPYIEDFLNELEEPIDSITIVDEAFKKALFANWIRNADDFHRFKAKYKGILESDSLAQQSSLLAERAVAALTAPTLVDPITQTNGANKIQTPAASSAAASSAPSASSTDPAIILTANETIGGALSEVLYNGTYIKITVPEALRHALFTYWEEKPAILPLLWSFAKDMDISVAMISANGKKLVIRPPPPPKDGKSHGHFKYTPNERCKYHDFFPTDKQVASDPSMDDYTLGSRNRALHKKHYDEVQDLTRTQASFACLSLLVMLMGFVFSMYTFLNPRYMFKRLAGGIHFISASTCFVVLQVLFHAVEYERENLSYTFPKGSEYSYGYGVYLSWLVFVINALAFIMFMWYSKKKKGAKAATEEMAMADEPINIGR